MANVETGFRMELDRRSYSSSPEMKNKSIKLTIDKLCAQNRCDGCVKGTVNRRENGASSKEQQQRQESQKQNDKLSIHKSFYINKKQVRELISSTVNIC